MLLTLILAANLNITLAELGRMSYLKQVYAQRILCSMEHKTFEGSSLPDNPSIIKWQLFCNFIHLTYSSTCSCMYLWIHWESCGSLSFWTHSLGLHKCLSSRGEGTAAWHLGGAGCSKSTLHCTDAHAFSAEIFTSILLAYAELSVSTTSWSMICFSPLPSSFLPSHSQLHC